jgi:hypothetical protein
MTAAPMLTPAEFAAIDTLIAIGLIAAIAGLAWAIRWASRGASRAWKRDAALIAADPREICLYCRQIAMTDCTCDRKCTAMVCLYGQEQRRG